MAQRTWHDAGIEYQHGLVGHGLQTLVALVEDHVGLLRSSAFGSSPTTMRDLALVNDRVKFGLDLGIENFADVSLNLKPASKSAFADTDADHVTLAGVHKALDAVEEGVDLALKDQAQSRAAWTCLRPRRSAHGDLGADRNLVDLRADDLDLVILDLRHPWS